MHQNFPLAILLLVLDHSPKKFDVAFLEELLLKILDAEPVAPRALADLL